MTPIRDSRISRSTLLGTSLLLGGLSASAALSSRPATRPFSSHREAPFVTENPKVDATDFYMFNSYEPGRDDMVVLVANYLPLQDGYGGPNYFTMDPRARYAIHVDNDGDASCRETASREHDQARRRCVPRECTRV
jgi:hypothetical protein